MKLFIQGLITGVILTLSFLIFTGQSRIELSKEDENWYRSKGWVQAIFDLEMNLGERIDAVSRLLSLEVNDSVSLDVIRATCIEGPGHYLGSEQTLNLMQTEYIYPDLGDRTSPKEWLELGKPDLLEKAIAKKNEILSKRSPAALDAETDGKIRSAFNIHLQI